jgi:sec-independent protein translocase protein TatA
LGEMSPWHWLIVIAIAVLLFGARRLPDAARSLGRSARILKAELHDEPRTPTPPDPDQGSETGSERPAEHTRRADDQTGT